MSESNAVAQYIKKGRDYRTGAHLTVDYAHHEIHEGSHYYVSGSTLMTDTQEVQFHVRTPNSTQWAHMRWEVNGLGLTHFDVYEDTLAGITGGTTMDPINNNRNSTKESVLTVVKNGATTSTGRQLEDLTFGRTATPVVKISVGGDAGREDELVLKQNAQYIFRIISDSTGNQISFKGFWYETSDKLNI